MSATIDDLPDEVVSLFIVNKADCSLVCKRFYRIARDLWSTLTAIHSREAEYCRTLPSFRMVTVLAIQFASAHIWKVLSENMLSLKELMIHCCVFSEEQSFLSLPQITQFDICRGHPWPLLNTLPNLEKISFNFPDLCGLDFSHLRTHCPRLTAIALDEWESPELSVGGMCTFLQSAGTRMVKVRLNLDCTEESKAETVITSVMKTLSQHCPNLEYFHATGGMTETTPAFTKCLEDLFTCCRALVKVMPLNHPDTDGVDDTLTQIRSACLTYAPTTLKRSELWFDDSKLLHTFAMKHPQLKRLAIDVGQESVRISTIYGPALSVFTNLCKLELGEGEYSLCDVTPFAGYLPHLQRLDLYNSGDKDDVHSLLAFVTSFSKVNFLLFWLNIADELEDDTVDMSSYLHSSCEYLDLSFSQPADSRITQYLLSLFPKVKRMVVAGDKGERFYHALAQCPLLEVIEGEMCPSEIHPSLCARWPKLEMITSFSMDDSAIRDAVTALNTLCASPILTEVVLSCLLFRAPELKRLLQALPRLRHLEFSSCVLTPACYDILCEYGTHISMLHLNTFGPMHLHEKVLRTLADHRLGFFSVMVETEGVDVKRAEYEAMYPNIQFFITQSHCIGLYKAEGIRNLDDNEVMHIPILVAAYEQDDDDED